MLTWDLKYDQAVRVWDNSRHTSNRWELIKRNKPRILAVTAVESIASGILEGTLGDNGLWDVERVELNWADSVMHSGLDHGLLDCEGLGYGHVGHWIGREGSGEGVSREVVVVSCLEVGVGHAADGVLGPWVGDLWWLGDRCIVATIDCVWLHVLGGIVDTVLSSVLLSTAVNHDVVVSSGSIDSVVCWSWAWVRVLLGRLVARV